jgi:hypothetical protein
VTGNKNKMRHPVRGSRTEDREGEGDFTVPGHRVRSTAKAATGRNKAGAAFAFYAALSS